MYFFIILLSLQLTLYITHDNAIKKQVLLINSHRWNNIEAHEIEHVTSKTLSVLINHNIKSLDNQTFMRKLFYLYEDRNYYYNIINIYD